jgi:hypothetical protein
VGASDEHPSNCLRSRVQSGGGLLSLGVHSRFFLLEERANSALPGLLACREFIADSSSDHSPRSLHHPPIPRLTSFTAECKPSVSGTPLDLSFIGLCMQWTRSRLGANSSCYEDADRALEHSPQMGFRIKRYHWRTETNQISLGNHTPSDILQYTPTTNQDALSRTRRCCCRPSAGVRPRWCPLVHH